VTGPTERRAITTIALDGRTHLVRIVPSDTAGPHGCNTLCYLTLPSLPNPDMFEFGPGLPDEAEKPDGMCTTCWKALCRSGAWKRETWDPAAPLTPITIPRSMTPLYDPDIWILHSARGARR
jgi:hypothetical protein